MTSYGWFEHEPNPDRISLAGTGQHLAIRPVPSSSGDESYDLAYTDSEFQCSLALTVVRRPHYSPLHTVQYPAWFSDPRHYGHWRRIDEFVVDALLCWPSITNTRAGTGLSIVGAWRSGAWQPTLRRNFRGGWVEAARTNDRRYVIAAPELVPLDLPMPPQWRLVSVDWPKTEARLEGVHRDSGVAILPRQERVSGFQGRVPYLVRADGNAFIFFSKLEPATYRDGEAETHLHYTYVDTDFFFTFTSAPRWGLSLTLYNEYGYRDTPPPRELWPVDLYGNVQPWDAGVKGFSHLGVRALRRISNVLHDAWPAWGNTRRMVKIDPGVRLPQNYGRVGYIGDYGPGMRCGYSAGLLDTLFEVWYS